MAKIPKATLPDYLLHDKKKILDMMAKPRPCKKVLFGYDDRQ
jgi:hypothetical protein